jgi:hypothetical protein
MDEVISIRLLDQGVGHALCAAPVAQRGGGHAHGLQPVARANELEYGIGDRGGTRPASFQLAARAWNGGRMIALPRR